MRKLSSFAVAAALVAVSASAAQSTAKKKPAVTNSRKRTASKSAPRKSTGNANRSVAASSRAKSRTTTVARRAPVTTWRNRQTAPTSQRYQEIQAALAGRGYLSQDDVNGAWGASSVEALKRFQADQKIDGAGKLNSLSIIALGLGPKYDSAAAVLPPKPPESH